MLSNRNLQQSNLSVSGALSGADRGVHMLPGGNGMGIMPGMNRSMPLPRPGFQGIASPSMLNPGNLLSPNMVGMPSPVNMHSGTGSGQGNSMRPREAMHYMRVNTKSFSTYALHLYLLPLALPPPPSLRMLMHAIAFLFTEAVSLIFALYVSFKVNSFMHYT
jgi:hypothetical protein